MILFKWSAAAAILIIVSTLFYFSQVSTKQASTVTSIPDNGEMPAEYAEEVYHFTKLIELKHNQLKKIEKYQPELYRQFAEDIAKLDSNYQILRGDARTS